MATYYVRSGAGNDANAGTSPGAAWKTIGKALLAGSPVVGGDTIYVGGGVYREVVAVAITPASTVNLVGDVDGAQTGDYGEVIWTGYTTNDTSAPSGGIVLNANGKNNIAVSKIHFVGSSANPFVSIPLSTGWSFIECSFQASGSVNGICIAITTTALVAANVTIDRCVFFGASANSAIRVTLATVTGGSDFDYNVLVQDCLMSVGSNGNGVEIISSGANANFGGGVRVFNCTIDGGAQGVYANSASLSVSAGAPAAKVYNSVILRSHVAALRANTSGQVVEDWNRLWTTTPRTNVSAGANSNSTTNLAMLLEIGQSFYQRRGARPFLSPMVGSPLLAFGAQAGGPSVDLLNRPRPGTYAVGAMELPPVFPGLGKGRLMGGG